MKRSKTTHKLAAALVSGAVVGASSKAFAGGSNTTLNNLTDNVITAASGIPGVITMISYLCGIALAVAGIFKLKQHVDNPGQTAMKDGVMRLAAGGALLALPFITGMMQGSIQDGGGVSADLGEMGTMATTGTADFTGG